MKAKYYRTACLAALAALASQPLAAQVTLERTGKLEPNDETLPSGEYFDTYTFQARAGDLLEATATSTEFDSYLIVRGPGDMRFENDDASASDRNARVTQRLPQDGEYSVAVTSYQSGETGRYRLMAQTSTGPIGSGTPSQLSGELASGDEQLSSGEFFDTFTFLGEQGDLVELRLSSSQFDPYLLLRGPDDASFENDDAMPGETTAAITVRLPASGEYRALATSYAPGERGDYDLAVAGAEVTALARRSMRTDFGAVDSGAQMTVGEPLTGALANRDQQLGSGEYFDTYTLSAPPGTALSVRMQSDSFDTFLGAFDAGSFEASNDDDAAGDTTDSRIELLMPASGTVTLAASSYSAGATGHYTLVAEPSSAERIGLIDPAGSAPITVGEAVSGTLERSDAVGQRGIQDSFVFQASAQQEIDFSLTSSDFDAFLMVEGPGGFRAENDDDPQARSLNSRLATVLPDAGTYRLVVTSYDGEGLGAYRLRTGAAQAGGTAMPLDAPSLLLGSPVSARLDDGDATLDSGEYADSYRFEGQRGQRLSFTMESDDFDTYLALTLPGGGREFNDDRAGLDNTNSWLPITLPEDGTYLLTATSFAADMTGDYTLNVQPADEAVRTIAPTSSQARVFALSIGVAEYARMDGLPLTDQDAIKLTQTLQATGVLAPESVTLVNAEATRANVAAALQTLSGQMGPDDLLLVFYSGHGDKVEGVSTEIDGSSETLELYDAPLHDWELAEMFAPITARTLLVIDACFSGGFDNVIDQRVDRMGIFSSDADVLSLVAEKYQAGGYVSLLLRQALEGGADSNGDLAITAGELSEYMRRGFYRFALQTPLDAGGEDFRGGETQGYQHLIVDRGGDGMPYGQILLRTSAQADSAP